MSGYQAAKFLMLKVSSDLVCPRGVPRPAHVKCMQAKERTKKKLLKSS